jgi:hypothetical protein
MSVTTAITTSSSVSSVTSAAASTASTSSAAMSTTSATSSAPSQSTIVLQAAPVQEPAAPIPLNPDKETIQALASYGVDETLHRQNLWLTSTADKKGLYIKVVKDQEFSSFNKILGFVGADDLAFMNLMQYLISRQNDLFTATNITQDETWPKVARAVVRINQEADIFNSLPISSRVKKLQVDKLTHVVIPEPVQRILAERKAKEDAEKAAILHQERITLFEKMKKCMSCHPSTLWSPDDFRGACVLAGELEKIPPEVIEKQYPVYKDSLDTFHQLVEAQKLPLLEYCYGVSFDPNYFDTGHDPVQQKSGDSLYWSWSLGLKKLTKGKTGDWLKAHQLTTKPPLNDEEYNVVELRGLVYYWIKENLAKDFTLRKLICHAMLCHNGAVDGMHKEFSQNIKERLKGDIHKCLEFLKESTQPKDESQRKQLVQLIDHIDSIKSPNAVYQSLEGIFKVVFASFVYQLERAFEVYGNLSTNAENQVLAQDFKKLAAKFVSAHKLGQNEHKYQVAHERIYLELQQLFEPLDHSQRMTLQKTIGNMNCFSATKALYTVVQKLVRYQGTIACLPSWQKDPYPLDLMSFSQTRYLSQLLTTPMIFSLPELYALTQLFPVKFSLTRVEGDDDDLEYDQDMEVVKLLPQPKIEDAIALEFREDHFSVASEPKAQGEKPKVQPIQVRKKAARKATQPAEGDPIVKKTKEANEEKKELPKK